MTALAILLAICSDFFLVIGHLFLKHAMNLSNRAPKPWPRLRRALMAGIALQAIWFFIWLGLLERWELSWLFPFAAIDPVLVVLGAWLFLHERISLQAWAGVIIIAGGIALVAGS